MRALPALLFALLTAPLLAQPAIVSLSPASGPTAGGTEVTIHGSFDPSHGVVVYFGEFVAASARVVDATRVVAVTPPHLPGRIPVWLTHAGGATPRHTEIRFQFIGGAPDAYERILVPVFTAPVHGAFGSEFRTQLRLRHNGLRSSVLPVFGFTEPPFCTCIPRPQVETPLLLSPDPREADETPSPVHHPSRPGLFLYTPRVEPAALAMNLRVFDVSRDDRNFGTEIPVVRDRDFFVDRITLLGIPTDPRFRNTLRIYSTEAQTLTVTIDNEIRTVTLTPGNNIYEPAYAVIGDFPTGTDPIRVTIDPIAGPIGPSPLVPPPPPPIWAFVSVTNNDTQLITTITPQR